MFRDIPRFGSRVWARISTVHTVCRSKQGHHLLYNHTARLTLVVETGMYRTLGKVYEEDEETLLLSPAQTLIPMRQSRNKPGTYFLHMAQWKWLTR